MNSFEFPDRTERHRTFPCVHRCKRTENSLSEPSIAHSIPYDSTFEHPVHPPSMASDSLLRAETSEET